jgi:origin recognition complex subunit 6
LKTTLNLPPIEPRPPCPPKVYKKLYGHFDTLLVSASTRRRREPRSNPATPSKPLPQRQTPGKERALEGFRSTRTPKRGLKYGSNKKEALPKWVGVAVRKICTEFDAGRAVPHVWAGVESVLFLPRPEDIVEGKDVKQDEKIKRNIPALVGAIFFYVVAALENKTTNQKEHFEDKKRIWKILRELKEDEESLKKVGEGEEGWEGWDCVEETNLKGWVSEINEWIAEIVEGGWLKMEWRTNIVDGSGASGKVDENVDGEVDGNGEEDEDIERASKRIRGAGRGTMMEAKFDYLSDEKREAYAIWKEAMLAKINDLVAEGIINGDMDTAEG